MKVLIVAATEFELEGIRFHKDELKNNLDLSFLTTGIGMVATTYTLAKKLSSNNYDLAINIGVAGSFKSNIPIGDVVEIASDRFADLGAEDDERFLSVSEMGLLEKNSFPFENEKLFAKNDFPSGLMQVNGITMNKVHGNKDSIHKIVERYDPDVESMEGAAFLYVCRMENLPCIQIRAISNYVEKRDKSKWKMTQAIQNLSSEVVEYLKAL